MTKHLFFVALFITTVVSGCGGNKVSTPEIPSIPQEGVSEPPRMLDSKSHLPSSLGPRPWELVQPGRDLRGERLVSASILRADDYFQDGKMASALDEYVKVEADTTLNADERAALALRLAVVHLNLDRANEALQDLSRYFRASALDVNQVSSEFALVFGFAFGRAGNLPQSLAWFSRAQQGEDPAIAERARIGIRELFNSCSDSELDQLVLAWRGDPYVAPILEEQRLGRVHFARPQSSGSYFDQFFGGKSVAVASGPTPTADGIVRLGVLLPFSGQYQKLGEKILQGLRLALNPGEQASAIPSPSVSPSPSESGATSLANVASTTVPVNSVLEGSIKAGEFELILRDTGPGPEHALSKAQGLVSQEHVSLLVGPLLAEDSRIVADWARGESVDIVSFSKRADVVSGQGVHRFAPSAVQQVRSLLDFLSNRPRPRALAILAGRDPTSQELMAALHEQLPQYRFTVVDQRIIGAGDEADLLKYGEDLVHTSAQGIICTFGVRDCSQFFTSLPPAVRQRVIPLGFAHWDSANEVKQSGVSLEGAFFVSPFFQGSARSMVASFVEEYRSRFGMTPDFLAAQAYDLGRMIGSSSACLHNPGETFGSCIAPQLPVEGLTGQIEISPSGEFLRAFSVVQVRDGEIVEPEVAGASVPSPEVTKPTITMRGNERISDSNVGQPVQH